MTLAGLSECLELPPRTLYRYRRDYPEEAPKNFDLESWREFIGKVRNYSAERTRPKDRNGNGTEPSAEDQNGEYSAGEERKQRILRLRLGNQMRRSSLERLSRNTVTMVECMESMSRIRAVVSAEILRLPASLAETLAGKDPAYIQVVLERAIHKSLEALSGPENYFKTETEHGANGAGGF
jgi:hypothetical protein